MDAAWYLADKLGEVMAANPDLDPANLVVGERVIIPWERDNDVAGPDDGFPFVHDEREFAIEYDAIVDRTRTMHVRVAGTACAPHVRVATADHLEHCGGIDAGILGWNVENADASTARRWS